MYDRVKAMVNLDHLHTDLSKAELVETKDGLDDEMVRFHWKNGTTVDVPVLAVERAFNVVCRDSQQLGPHNFGQPS